MLTKDRSFYNSFFAIFRVLIIHNVIVLGVNLVDNIMLGAYSQDALSGVAAVNQIQFIFQQIVSGLGDAVVVLGSQYYGQKRTDPIKSIASGSMYIGIAIGAVLFLLGALIPETVVGLFTESDAIVASGAEYLRVMKYSYIVFALTNILLAVLRSIEKVKIAFYVSISTLFVNIGLNYVLIYGKFGFPALGVTGAAIATLIARIVELAIVLIYVLVFDKKLGYSLKSFVRPNFTFVRDYAKLCLPFIAVAAVFGISTALQTVILGHMNDDAIAANSAASTLYMVLKVAAVGASSAASVIIGKAIGSGDMSKIKEYTRTLQVIFLTIGVLTSITLFITRLPILALYTSLSESARAMANDFILVLCVTCIGTSYEMPVICGIIRGGGDANFVLINDLISIWGIVLPLSFLGAFVFNFPPALVIFCLNSDQLFKCIAAAIKANRYHWMKKLTRKEETPV